MPEFTVLVMFSPRRSCILIMPAEKIIDYNLLGAELFTIAEAKDVRLLNDYITKLCKLRDDLCCSDSYDRADYMLLTAIIDACNIERWKLGS